MDNNNIFYGVPPAECRLFLADYLKKNKDKYTRFVNPTSGRMGSTITMIKSDVEKSKIFNYDIGFVPTVVGNYFSNQSLDNMNIEIKSCDYDNPGKTPAELLFQSKLSQIKTNNAYMEQIKKSILLSRIEHIDFIQKLLEAQKIHLDGIHYGIKDLNDTLKEFTEETDFIYFDPPIYGGDYDNAEECVEEVINWNRPKITMFNPDHLENFFEELAKSPATIMLYYNVKDVSKKFEFPEGWKKVFVKKVNDKRSIYILMNRNFAKTVAINTIKNLDKGKYQIFTDAYELTKQSRISFKNLDNNQTAYYRNLFLHKLKSGNGVELNCGLFIDDRIFI